MGIFTNRCRNDECRNRVRKGSKFCPKCGQGAPRGLSVCGSCSSEVSTSSKFCWKCGSDLAAVAKPFIVNDRWTRNPEDFAVRVESADIKGRLAKPLNIEHGTRAIFFQQGKYKGELKSGSYDMGGFLKRVNHFMIDQTGSVVLVDDGDVTIDLENGDLWTADNIEVGAVSRLVLQIAKPESMFVNMLKGRNRLTIDDIEQQLAGEVQMVIAAVTSQYTAEELFTDPEIRNEIEEKLSEATAETLKRLGLELVQLRFISFCGEAWEKLRTERGELTVETEKADMTEERMKLAQRLRESMSQEKMHEFKSDKDFEDFIRQTEHELGLKDVIREDEMERLKTRFHFDRGQERLLRRIEIRGVKDDFRRERAWKELQEDERHSDEKLQRMLQRELDATGQSSKKQEIELRMSRLQKEEEIRQGGAEFDESIRQEREKQKIKDEAADKGMDRLERTKKMEREEDEAELEREKQRIETFSNATAEALIAITDGPASERLAKLEELRAREDMTPDQILALTAKDSPEAARALAKKYENEGKLGEEKAELLQKQLEDQKQMSEGYAERMERIMHTGLEQMGTVAGTRARPVDPKQTVVAPGMGTSPTVINPQQPSGAGKTCKHCDAALQSDGGFCAECGKKQ